MSVRDATRLEAAFILREKSSDWLGQIVENASQVARPSSSAPVSRREPSLNLSPATAPGPYRNAQPPAGVFPRPSGSSLRKPDDWTIRETGERYIRAFEAADVDTLVTLLTDEAVMEMPPVPLWYVGRANYGRFIDRVFAMRPTPWRMIPAEANGQPALTAYCADESGTLRLHTLQVLTVTADGIACNVVFADPRVFAAFGLAQVLEPGR